MKLAVHMVEVEIYKPRLAIALDYILHNNNEMHFNEQLRKNELRVKLKNAIMQTWSKIKEGKSPPSMNDLIENIVKTNKEKKGGGNFFEER